MKKVARVTSKRQITVPQEVRRAMGIRPGDRLLFKQTGPNFIVQPLRTEDPLDKYQGIGNPQIPSGKKRIVHYFRRLRGQ